MDWEEIVHHIGRSRTDFTLKTWDEHLTDTKIIRLICNCCGAWCQQAIPYEVLGDSYYLDLFFTDTIEQLVRFMLRVDDIGGRYADRRTIAGSGTNT